MLFVDNTLCCLWIILYVVCGYYFMLFVDNTLCCFWIILYVVCR